MNPTILINGAAPSLIICAGSFGNGLKKDLASIKRFTIEEHVRWSDTDRAGIIFRDQVAVLSFGLIADRKI